MINTQEADLYGQTSTFPTIRFFPTLQDICVAVYTERETYQKTIAKIILMEEQKTVKAALPVIKPFIIKKNETLTCP